MPDKITEDQLDELLDARDYFGADKFVKLMAEYTGIVVKTYTGYQYFDAADNFLGDSEWNSLRDILEEAEIEVVDNG